MEREYKDYMKCICYIDHLSNGGAQRVMSILANALAERGYEVVLITDIRLSEYKEYLIDKRIKRVILHSDSKRRKISRNTLRLYLLRKYIKKEKPQVVISFLGGCNIRMLISTIGIHVKKIVSVRSDPNREYGTSLIVKQIVNNLFKKADGVVFQTKGAMEYFANKIKQKSTVILNPISDDFYFEEINVNQENNIIFVGCLRPEKNVQMLIRAFSQIADENDYKLLICGDGPEKSVLNNLVRNLHLEDRVIFRGHVDYIRDELKRSKIFVLTSDYEGMPNALMEAMAMNMACIATDCPCGGPKELALRGDELVLVPAGNDNALSKQLRLVIGNDNLRMELANNAKKRAEDFRTNIICDQWEVYIDRIVNDRKMV